MPSINQYTYNSKQKTLLNSHHEPIHITKTGGCLQCVKHTQPARNKPKTIALSKKSKLPALIRRLHL